MKNSYYHVLKLDINLLFHIIYKLLFRHSIFIIFMVNGKDFSLIYLFYFKFILFNLSYDIGINMFQLLPIPLI